MQTILNDIQINQKINRLAHQVIEDLFEEEIIHIGGIKGNGYVLAEKIHQILEQNKTVQSKLFQIEIDKNEPWNNDVNFSIPLSELKNGVVILVDDVLNSGKTMQYALVETLKFPTKLIRTLTLVDRKHRRFPVRADYVGLTLSTTLKEHVEVTFDNGNTKVYLK